jgi:hypothetical protein
LLGATTDGLRRGSRRSTACSGPRRTDCGRQAGGGRRGQSAHHSMADSAALSTSLPRSLASRRPLSSPLHARARARSQRRCRLVSRSLHRLRAWAGKDDPEDLYGPYPWDQPLDLTAGFGKLASGLSAAAPDALVANCKRWARRGLRRSRRTDCGGVLGRRAGGGRRGQSTALS